MPPEPMEAMAQNPKALARCLLAAQGVVCVSRDQYNKWLASACEVFDPSYFVGSLLNHGQKLTISSHVEYLLVMGEGI